MEEPYLQKANVFSFFFLFSPYNSVVFSVFTRLCNHCNFLVLKCFPGSREKHLLPVIPQPSLLLVPSILGQLSDFTDLPVLDISYNWCRTIYDVFLVGLFPLACFMIQQCQYPIPCYCPKYSVVQTHYFLFAIHHLMDIWVTLSF